MYVYIGSCVFSHTFPHTHVLCITHTHTQVRLLKERLTESGDKVVTAHTDEGEADQLKLKVTLPDSDDYTTLLPEI